MQLGSPANNQTKNVLTATAIFFVLSLLAAAAGSLQRGYLDPLDTMEPFNPEVLAEWVGQLGGVPLIAALITVAVTARKAGWRSSLANAVGIVVGIPLVLTMIVMTVSLALATPGEKPFAGSSMGRRAFVAQATASCMKKAGAGAKEFCSCYATHFADNSTRAAIIANDTAMVRGLAANAAEACRQSR